MKKIRKSLYVLLCMIMCLVLAAPLTGCSSKEKDDKEEQDTEEQETAKEKREKKKKEREKKRKEEPEEPDTDEDQLYALADGGTADTVFIIDKEGNLIKDIPTSELKKNLPETDYPELVAYGDGYFFYRIYTYDEADNAYYSSFYAINEEDDEATFLYDVKKGYPDSMDYYDGAFRVVVSYYDSTYAEYVVSVKDGKPEKPVADENPVIKAVSDGGYYIYAGSGNGNFSWETACNERLLDSNGFIIAKSDGNYISIDREGNETELSSLGKQDIVICYSNGYVIYASDETENVYGLDLNDDDAKAVEICSRKDFQSLGFFEDKYYYVLYRKEGDFRRKCSDIFVYDPKEESSQKLYENEPAVGTNGMIGESPSGFRVLNGNVYSETLIDGNIEFAKVSCSGSKPEYTAMGCVVKEVSAYKYGDVIYDSKRQVCPNCGTVLSEDYEEAFILDAKYSEHADEINEVTRGALELAMAVYDDPVEYSEEDCQSHLEDPIMWDMTTEYYISNVFIIDDRYLAINMDGYWYGGGAHGSPLRNQYLFDLETGESKTLSDFYKGTTEEFKELVARATADDFLTYEDGDSPYFAESEEEVYSQAYEEADPVYSNVEF
ncbi:MAG: hypothetical protein K5888_12170, partial [Lachnospiraceae bacterium]|nr:hypothetical protein [Lachnospiraceae bacterium]